MNAANSMPDYIDETKFEAYAKKQQVVTDKVTHKISSNVWFIFNSITATNKTFKYNYQILRDWIRMRSKLRSWREFGVMEENVWYTYQSMGN